jgi:pimeloyl-ACP methyl ester carboxylesterase
MEILVELDDGARIHAEDQGSGPVVTLLHPGLWDLRTWDPQVEPLQDAGFRVVRYDQRGYGRSSRPEPGAAYSHVGDLAAVLEALGVESTALVGCSMGGALAIDAALTFPDRVWALVPVASGLGGFESTKEEDDWYAELETPIEDAIEAGDLERAQELRLELLWAPLGTGDLAGSKIREIAFDNLHELEMDESGAEQLDPPAAHRLHEIDVPTLIVRAPHDPPDMQRISDVLGTQILGARAVTIEGADHVVNLRQPERFNEALVEFLEAASPRAV